MVSKRANKLFYPLLLLLSITTRLNQSQITEEELDDLRTELREEFDASGRFRDLLASTVRLIFHDCSGPPESGDAVSICNGCIDFSNEDHAGLVAQAVNPLEDIYNKSGWSDQMSRADFWATAGNEVYKINLLSIE